MPLRSTQRAPQSCLTCSKKKVKCNKRIPCSLCIRRGEASQCAREKVVVTRKAMSTPPMYQEHDYDELILDNLRLKSRVLESTGLTPEQKAFEPDMTIYDHFVRLLEKTESDPQPSTVWYETLSAMPPKDMSFQLVGIALQKTAWYQFSLHWPTFAIEHENFWDADLGGKRTFYNPRWLALYFAVISAVLYMMEESTLQNVFDLSPERRYQFIRNWVDSAMFFLAKAKYIDVPHLQCLQAIVILKEVFTFEHQHRKLIDKWPTALDLAQRLGIDDEKKLSRRPALEAEICRRIWWTLVSSEWLLMPLRKPSIDVKDFNVNLPALLDDDELSGIISAEETSVAEYPRPVHYLLVLIRGARIAYDFYDAIQQGTWTEENFATLVNHTDERLAQIIMHLPDYLQADYKATGENAPYRDANFPGIAQQRLNICLFLLEARINVNELMQGLQGQSKRQLSRLRFICLGSSRAILSLTLKSTSEQLKIWFNISNIYLALTQLVRNLQANPDDDPAESDMELVKQGCEKLRSIQGDSHFAQAAYQAIYNKIRNIEGRQYLLPGS